MPHEMVLKINLRHTWISVN